MMHRLTIITLALVLLGAGCLSSSANLDDATDSPSEESLTTNKTLTVKPTPSGANEIPVYNDSVWLARSTDAEIWTLDEEVLIEHASVPNITRLTSDIGEFEAGTLMIVYVDATEMATGESGKERTGRYVSTDNGETWEDIGPAIYVGAEGHVPVDPNLVQLQDGTLRMYYYDFAEQKSFYAADSTNGETFTVVGEVFSTSQLTDPEVSFYEGKFYLFYASNEGIRVAVGSKDGLSFTQTDLSGNPQGIPGVMEVDGKLRLFGCVINKGIVYYTADESLEFGEPVSIASGFRGAYCDPDPVELDDGSFLLVVKKLPDPTKK